MGKIKEYIIRIFSKTWSACLVTIILMAIIMFCRKPDAFLNPQFWAEDGVIFFKQNIDYGLKSLVTPYAGYLHTVQRVIALIASWFPVSLAPAIYNYSALGLMLLTAGSLFSSRCFIPWKPLAALSLVLIPHSGEVFMNITNIHWYLCLLMLILLCKAPPYKYYHYLFDYLIIIICGLSGPFIIFIFPLFLVRYLTKKTKHNFGILLAAFICILIQGWLIFNTFGSENNGISHNTDAYINILGIRLFGRLFLIKNIYKEIPPIILAVISIILPILLIYFTESKRHRYLILTFLFFGFAIVASTLYKFKGYPELLAYDVMNGDRYFYIPLVMIMWSLVVYLDSMNVLRRQIVSVLIILILISTAQKFRSLKYVDYHWENYAKKIESGEYVRVPINPPGWCFDVGTPEDIQDDIIIDPNENNM